MTVIETEKVKCPKCDRAFENEHGLSVHDARMHKEKKTKVECDICHQQIVATYLTAHKRKAHDIRVREKKEEEIVVASIDDEPVIGIIPLLEILFPMGVPVRKLETVYRWIEVTKEMMQ